MDSTKLLLRVYGWHRKFQHTPWQKKKKRKKHLKNRQQSTRNKIDLWSEVFRAFIFSYKSIDNLKERKIDQKIRSKSFQTFLAGLIYVTWLSKCLQNWRSVFITYSFTSLKILFLPSILGKGWWKGKIWKFIGQKGKKTRRKTLCTTIQHVIVPTQFSGGGNICSNKFFCSVNFGRSIYTF